MGFRKPDLSGAWYPGGEKEIRKTIEGYISKIIIPDEKYAGKGGIVLCLGQAVPQRFFCFGMTSGKQKHCAVYK